MKIIKTLIVGILALSLSACSATDTSTENNEIEANIQTTENNKIPSLENDIEEDTDVKDEKLVVYSTFFPIYDFTNRIGGNKIDLRQLIPKGVAAHDFEPTSQDIVNLEKADLLIINGNNLEGWADDIINSLNNPIELCDSGKDLDVIEGEDHSHNHQDENEDKENHKHDDHNHLALDPHTWTSPKMAIKQMENIKNKLVQLDPANAAYYTENYNEAMEDFSKLDNEFKTKIKSFSSKDLIVSHEAFSYMAKDYGLNQIGIEALIPESEPTPQKMAEIIDFVKENDIKAIYFENNASSKVADAIANETGVKVLSLNTLESITEDEEKNGEDYLSLMRKNLYSLEEGLK